MHFCIKEALSGWINISIFVTVYWFHLSKIRRILLIMFKYIKAFNVHVFLPVKKYDNGCYVTNSLAAAIRESVRALYTLNSLSLPFTLYLTHLSGVLQATLYSSILYTFTSKCLPFTPYLTHLSVVLHGSILYTLTSKGFTPCVTHLSVVLHGPTI